MGSASDPPAHPARNLPAGSSYRLNKPPAAVETSIGPPHYSAECTHSHASVQPSLRARTGHANSDSFGAANALSVYNGKLGNEVEGRLARWLEWCGRRRVVVHRSRSQFARCKVKLTMRAPGIIRAGPARLFAVIVPAMLIPTLLGARLYRIALVEGDDFHAGR